MLPKLSQSLLRTSNCRTKGTLLHQIPPFSPRLGATSYKVINLSFVFLRPDIYRIRRIYDTARILQVAKRIFGML